MVKRFAIFCFAILTSGCGAALNDFVKSTVPSNLLPVVQNNRETPLKVSPGYMEGSDTGAAVSATVTTTDRLYPAGDVSVRLTLGRSRVSSQ